jgi:hypothetical protein
MNVKKSFQQFTENRPSFLPSNYNLPDFPVSTSSDGYYKTGKRLLKLIVLISMMNRSTNSIYHAALSALQKPSVIQAAKQLGFHSREELYYFLCGIISANDFQITFGLLVSKVGPLFEIAQKKNETKHEERNEEKY